MNESNDNYEIVNGIYLYDLIDNIEKDYDVKLNSKINMLFKNLIITFNKTNYTISNFINNRIGPYINIDKLSEENLITGIIDSGDTITIEYNELSIKKSYCPICGSVIKNYTFDLSNSYLTGGSDKKYFEYKTIYRKNNNKKSQNSIKFHYISCSNCINSIYNNYNKFGKPLRNQNLYNLYKLVSDYLGLEIYYDLNKITKSRCIYPKDRLYFKKDKYVYYFNLFILCDYVYYKFNQYFQNIGWTEDEIKMGLSIVLTEKSLNPFDENSVKVYRDFEKFLLEEVEKEFCTDKFFIDHLNGFDFKVNEESLNGENLSINCLKNKNCNTCKGNLSIPNKKWGIDTLFSSICNRENENSCKIKKFSIDNKDKGEKMSILSPEESHLLSSEENKQTIETTATNKNDDNIIMSEEAKELNNQTVVNENNIEKENVEDINNKKVENEVKEDIDEEIEFVPGKKLEETIKGSNELFPKSNNKEENHENEMKISKEERSNIKVNKEEVENEVKEDIDEEIIPIHIQKNKKSSIINKIMEVNNNEVEEKESIISDDLESTSNSDFKDENDSLIKEYSKEADKFKNLSIEEKVESIILYVEEPSTEVIIDNYKEYSKNNKIESNSFEERLKFGMEIYLINKARSIFKETNLNKNILNKYPGLTKKDLSEYLFEKDIKTYKSSHTKSTNKEETISVKNLLEKTNSSTLDEDDIINKMNAEKREFEIKQSQKYEKNKSKIAPTVLFKINDIRRNNPYVLEETLQDIYKKSVFNSIFSNVLKIDGYKAGNINVIMEKRALFMPIVDFPDIGVRFFCINTSDTRHYTFQTNPVHLLNTIPFTNKNQHRIYFLYSNECLTRPQQVIRSIYKIVNSQYFDPKHIVRLSQRYNPLAYTVEKIAMNEFEADHSIFSGIGRAKNFQITIIEFIENSNQSKNDYIIAKRLSNRAIKGFGNRNYREDLSSLLDEYDMVYILSAHIIEDKEWTTINGENTQYIHYTITQYTESIAAIIEDGLAIIVAAIIKEHKIKYQNTPYAITYEYDRTALVSPSIRNLLTTTTGIFEIDPTSRGQSNADAETNWVISEGRFQRSSNPIDDRARQDRRYFTASEGTIRNFLGGKIRPDENLSDINKVLSRIGYNFYPEPKSFNFEITTYGLDLIENSNIFKYLFRIEISKLYQSNGMDSYNEALQDLFTAKMMMKNNSFVHNDGAKELFNIFESGAKVAQNIFDNFKNK